MAYIIKEQFLQATQECFENSIVTGIIELASNRPDLDKLAGYAFLEKKKLWSKTNKGYCVKSSPNITSMISAVVTTDANVSQEIHENLRDIVHASIRITLEFQKSCLREKLFSIIEIDENCLEVLDDQQLSLERGLVSGQAYRAANNAAEKLRVFDQISNDPTWNKTLEQTVAPGNGLITNNGELSKNPNAQGFASEFKIINTFNAQAAASESPYRALSSESFGGQSSKDAPDIQIIDLRTGDIIDEIQIKSGSTQYVNSSISNDRYGEMKKLYNLEAGIVDGAIKSYESPDKKIEVNFTNEEARNIARDPQEYVDGQRKNIEAQMLQEKVNYVSQTLIFGSMSAGGLSATAGFAECLGAIALGDIPRSRTILLSIPERVKDATFRNIGQSSAMLGVHALLGATPITAGLGIVGIDVVRCFGSVFKGQLTPEEAFRDISPRTLGTMASGLLCIANPGIAAGIIGYRFAYSFIQSYRKEISRKALIHT